MYFLFMKCQSRENLIFNTFNKFRSIHTRRPCVQGGETEEAVFLDTNGLSDYSSGISSEWMTSPPHSCI